VSAIRPLWPWGCSPRGDGYRNSRHWPKRTRKWPRAARFWRLAERRNPPAPVSRSSQCAPNESVVRSHSTKPCETTQTNDHPPESLPRRLCCCCFMPRSLSTSTPSVRKEGKPGCGFAGLAALLPGRFVVEWRVALASRQVNGPVLRGTHEGGVFGEVGANRMKGANRKGQ